jgi:hypothetical protein
MSTAIRVTVVGYGSSTFTGRHKRKQALVDHIGLMSIEEANCRRVTFSFQFEHSHPLELYSGSKRNFPPLEGGLWTTEFR